MGVHVLSTLERALDREIGERKLALRTAAAAPDVEPASGRLGNYPQIALNRKAMERSRLLPFVDQRAVNAYKLLRTRLLQRMRNNGWRSLIVTGIGPDEGKTTTAVNLAIGASRDVSQGVLLVDLDLKRPAVAPAFGLERSAGLSDYFRGDAGVDDILYNTELERLALLPNFDSMTSHGPLVGPRMTAILEHVRRIDPERLLVFDMCPVLSSDDVVAFAPHVDAVLLVIAEGRTSRALLQRADEMLEGIPRVGVVLNYSSEGDAAFDY